MPSNEAAADGERTDVVPTLLAGIGLESLFDDRETDRGDCDCDLEFDGRTLVVDASACDGTLAEAPSCRRSVVAALVERDADAIVVRSNGLQYRYDAQATALLGAAGRFVELLGSRDDGLAHDVARDPLGEAPTLETRVDQLGDIALESGLLDAVSGVDEYTDVFSPRMGLEIAYYFVERTIDDTDGPRLTDVRELETGSTARIYERADRLPLYALEVVDLSLSPAERELLVDGYEAIAEGWVDGDRAPSRAVELVSDGDDPVDPTLTAILEKHTDGYGVLEDLFADPAVTDVYATSPVTANPLRVECDGVAMETNVHLTETGAEALASRIRRTSGRAFSRAKPTIDATASLANGRGLRIAGVTDPVADGTGFAFRERSDDRFTLPALVANGTVPPAVAGFLSVAIERNAAALIAGTRGAGKTTLLGTLLYEVTPDTRTVLIEDTPELPVAPLQSVGRDVQALRTGTGDGPEISPADALRTALRLGDGALVVGEIRGEEAAVLYEAMRVGANANAVLGTIHGDGAAAVYERVVSDLGVEPSSFAATDLVVTVQSYRTADGRSRRVARVEEVLGDGEDVRFEPLYELEGTEAVATGRIDRGESRFVNAIAGPTEAYADVRAAIADRTDTMRALAEDGRVSPDDVAAAYADRG
ncbi:type II/IV secretion system ATPase subunit [Halopiger aswanensis]|uniref:Type IV secretory pathway ATPase VirB11/archaellum biosynthesis ATPase n=1 Tax=Halopiger aswanensis TaxID=148449 RepID=A0A3R7HK37_9EURY|nr:type II/IV secretion system ATPase subunit [Halopiger aswanensis]RKD97461.1 type IV secretory pathway ATPase VirB11/archaellum biosynthesis ATPase [Halopiger aswanensis]